RPGRRQRDDVPRARPRLPHGGHVRRHLPLAAGAGERPGPHHPRHGRRRKHPTRGDPVSDRPAETPTPDREPATQPLGHATEEPTTQPLDYAGSEPADEPVQQTGEPAGPPAPEPGAPSGPAGATPWRPASERSDGDEPPVWSAATLSERSEE